VTVTRTTRKPIVYVAGAAAVLVAVLVVLALSSSPSTVQTVSGTYDLDAGYAHGCVGAGDYVGVYDGAPVWVLDEAGHPLAHSTLVLSDSDRSVCHFTFAVAGADDPFWVQVGPLEKTRISDGLALRSGPPRQP
jgi:hypothetical protein